MSDGELVIGWAQPARSVDSSAFDALSISRVVPPALTAQELSDERLEVDHPAAPFDELAVLDADIAARPVHEDDCLLAIGPRRGWSTVAVAAYDREEDGGMCERVVA